MLSEGLPSSETMGFEIPLPSAGRGDGSPREKRIVTVSNLICGTAETLIGGGSGELLGAILIFHYFPLAIFFIKFNWKSNHLTVYGAFKIILCCIFFERTLLDGS